MMFSPNSQNDIIREAMPFQRSQLLISLNIGKTNAFFSILFLKKWSHSKRYTFVPYLLLKGAYWNLISILISKYIPETDFVPYVFSYTIRPEMCPNTIKIMFNTDFMMTSKLHILNDNAEYIYIFA